MDLETFLTSYTKLDRAETLRQLEILTSTPLPAPEHAVNLVYAFQEIGELKVAITYCNFLVNTYPDFAPGWARLGQLELALGKPTEALQSAEKANFIDPECDFSRVCFSIVLHSLGMVTEATKHLAKALHQNPDNPVAWSYYGLCLCSQFQHELGLAALQKAIDLDPTSSFHWSNYLMSQHYDSGVVSQQFISSAERFSAYIGETTQQLEPTANEIIHIAYLSPDLYNHPVGRLLIAILKAHDHKHFKFTILADGTKSDSLTQQIAASAHEFIATNGLDNTTLSNIIRVKKVDVLVDLAGHTAGNRLPLFAQRVAPVQLAWLGYFGTTGLKNMDAVVLGEAHCSASTQSFYCENLRTVPGTHFVYQKPDYLPERQHLPAKHIRFASFNNTAKLNTEVIACWAKILQLVPDSSLTLKWKSLSDPSFARHIANRFGNFGISSDRLLLEPHTDHLNMLESYNAIDIALDPFPYSGGITSFEAMSMGVPLITYPWQRPASRQGAALLKQLAYPELIAGNANEYIQIAVALANDTERRVRLHAELPQKLSQHCSDHAIIVASGLEEIFTDLTRNL